MSEREKDEPLVIGWREWVGLPDLGIKRVKAKVDTGARSSALHAYDIHEFDCDGEKWVRFKVHPIQRNSRDFKQTQAKILDYRVIRSSNGKSEKRPVVMSTVGLLGVHWPVELTLTNRDAMGFRMLLGRQAIRGRFLVDSNKSYYGGKPKRKKRKRSTTKSDQKELK